MLLAQEISWLSAIGDFINRVGFPIATLVVFGFGVFFALRWLAQRLEKVIEGHMVYLERGAKTNEQNSEIQRQNTVVQGDTLRVLEEMQTVDKGTRRAFGHIANAVQEIAPTEKVAAVSGHIRRAHEELNGGK